MPARVRALFIFLIGLTALVAAGAIYLLARDQPPPDRPSDLAPKFILTDQDGRTVTERDFRGRSMLVFFGFTNCPDVCPLTLQKIADTLEMTPELKGKVTPVFISVDPERDTPEAMKTYAAYFSPDVRALTGTRAQVDAAIKAFKVYAKRVELPDSALGYTMDHSSLIYLYGPDGAFVTGWDPSIETEKLAEDLRKKVR